MEGSIVFPHQRLNYLKTSVMAGSNIFGTDITQANDQKFFHKTLKNNLRHEIDGEKLDVMKIKHNFI